MFQKTLCPEAPKPKTPIPNRIRSCDVLGFITLVITIMVYFLLVFLLLGSCEGLLVFRPQTPSL